jgi:hypothetical protein
MLYMEMVPKAGRPKERQRGKENPKIRLNMALYFQWSLPLLSLLSFLEKGKDPKL